MSDEELDEKDEELPTRGRQVIPIELRLALVAGAHKHGVTGLVKRLVNVQRSSGRGGTLSWTSICAASLGIPVAPDHLERITMCAEHEKLFELEPIRLSGDEDDEGEEEDSDEDEGPTQEVAVASVVDPTTGDKAAPVVQGWAAPRKRAVGLIDPTTREPVVKVEQGWPAPRELD